MLLEIVAPQSATFTKQVELPSGHSDQFKLLLMRNLMLLGELDQPQFLFEQVKTTINQHKSQMSQVA